MSRESLTMTTVVMVSYHTGPVLTPAIESVLAQTGPVELIVVDNGNPPEVLQALMDRAAEEPRMKLLTGHGNIGFGRACNLGAKAGGGAFLLFLNPDCLMPPDVTGTLVRLSDDIKRPFMLGVRLLEMNGKEQRGCRRALLTPLSAFVESFSLHRWFPKLRLNWHHEPVPAEMTPVPAISGAFMFMPRADFWRIKGFDEGYFLHVEDMDLCLRFRRAGGEIYFVPSISLTHFGHTSNVPSLFLERQKAISFCRYFHENFGHAYPQPVLWLLDGAIWARYYVMKLRPRVEQAHERARAIALEKAQLFAEKMKEAENSKLGQKLMNLDLAKMKGGQEAQAAPEKPTPKDDGQNTVS